MAIYSFQHKFVSLKQNGAGRAAAGVRYATRSVADHVTYIGFDPNKFVARQQMQAIEDAQPRKDGRIYHLFIGAIPRELNDAEKQHLVNRVAWQMSNGGKAPVIASIHDQASHNPHLHLILVDRKVSFSRETVYEERADQWGRMRRRAKTVHRAELGESVNLLTHNRRQRMERGLEPNATEWAREIWERVSNEELALAGQDARIDRRTLLEQGIEREAQKHLGIIRDERTAEELAEAANENQVYEGIVQLPELYDSVVQLPPLNQPVTDCNGLPPNAPQEGDNLPPPFEEPERAARTEIDRGAENKSAAQEEVPVPELYDSTVQLSPPDAPTHELLESPASAHEQEFVQEDDHIADAGNMVSEDDMANSASRVAQTSEREDTEPEGPGRIVAGKEPVSVVAKVRGAYQLSQRLKETKSQRKLLTTALSWKEAAQERSDEAARSAAILMQQEQGFERRHTHGHVNGTAQLRGYQAPSWSFLPSAVRGWQSKARKEALAAQSRLDDRREEHAVHVRNRDEAQRTSEQWEQHTRPQAQNVPGHPNYAWLSAAEQKEALAEMEQAEQLIETKRQDRLEGLTPEAVWTAYKAEEITLDEAKDAAQAAGFEQLAEALENEAAQEQEEGLGA